MQLIDLNIYISFAALALAMSTQVQLGMKPQWHPYLFIIFFATLFEYNLYRFISILTHSSTAKSGKYAWAEGKLNWFYALMFFSVLGFSISVVAAKLKVLYALAPIAIFTLFYSTPLTKGVKGFFRLRQVPYLKIFMIAFVWTAATILLPLIHSEKTYHKFHLIAMAIERFLFVFAITIPFDIRDMVADRQADLKTIPLKIGEKKSILLSQLSMILFFAIAVVHYSITKQWFIIGAFSVSFCTTIIFIVNKKIQNLPLYHYGILDGTMLLQGILVILFYYINIFFY